MNSVATNPLNLLACFLLLLLAPLFAVDHSAAAEGAKTETTRITLTYRDPQPNSGEAVADKRQRRLERQENIGLFGSLGAEDEKLVANGPDNQISIVLDITPRIIHVENSDIIRFETSIKEVSKWFGDAVRDDALREARNEYAMSLIRLHNELKRALIRPEAEELEQEGTLQLDMVNSEFQSVFSHFELLNDPLEKITLVYTPKDPLPNIRIVKLGEVGTAFEPRNLEYDVPFWVEVYYESEPLNPPTEVDIASIESPANVPILRLNKEEFIWRSRAVVLRKEEEDEDTTDPFAGVCNNSEIIFVGYSPDGTPQFDEHCLDDNEPEIVAPSSETKDNGVYIEPPVYEDNCFNSPLDDIEFFKCTIEEQRRNAEAYDEWAKRARQQGALMPGTELNPFDLSIPDLGNSGQLQDSISSDLLGIAQPDLLEDGLLPQSPVVDDSGNGANDQQNALGQLSQTDDPLGLQLDQDNIQLGDNTLPDLTGITDPRLDNTPITPNSADTANLGEALSINNNVRQDDRVATDNPLGILPEEGEFRLSDDILPDLTGIANTPRDIESILPDISSSGNDTIDLPLAPRVNEESLSLPTDEEEGLNEVDIMVPELPEMLAPIDNIDGEIPLGINQNNSVTLNAGTPIMSSTSRPDLGALGGTPLGELILKLGKDSPVILQLTKDGIQEGDQLAAKAILDVMN